MNTTTVTESMGFVANILSNVAFVPQIIKSYRTKKVEDISISMFLMLFTTQLCWIAYAIPLHARNLWISSLIEIILLIPIFIMWAKYRKNKSLIS
ncbi:MAG: PQ-loop repeat-containing protein [Gammaproteobacteria bacterium]|nr:PQ-loop repeat-containing protein [Gammaproteobacteria bacterium]